jgi:hypothetical protein
VGALPFGVVVGVKRWWRWLSPASASAAMGRGGNGARLEVKGEEKNGAPTWTVDGDKARCEEGLEATGGRAVGAPWQSWHEQHTLAPVGEEKGGAWAGLGKKERMGWALETVPFLIYSNFLVLKNSKYYMDL